ncbi:MAG: adenylate/guanylate cyclase domain-containing protein [Solirubrobacterales bacterium]|nr:adenylate/guanylate cyclase domain-containing protein [Solirubrobacterales bacterium]
MGDAGQGELARRVVRQAAAATVVANLGGAAVVFALLYWVMPLPDIDDADAAKLTNAIVFLAFLAVAVPVGTVWSLRLFRPVGAWLSGGEPAGADDQRRALTAPIRQLLPIVVLWLAGGALFVVLNAHFAWRLALIVGITAALGAAATATLGYLLDERIMRPVAARALRDGPPDRLAAPGVRERIALTWALCTGVPVLGLTLIGVAQLAGTVEASGDRLAATAMALGGIALAVGLAAMALTARSVADPLRGMREAVAAVQRGDTDVEVPVYDGSEVGLLQAGFNQMVSGLREREHLRDLFGRQVGEDVAREALERGTELGGEVRDVAALFIDLVGSTELAHERPPTEVVELLNELFCVVVEVVGEHGGFVNKFEGDAALCLFGAPLPREDACADALAAAREMRARLREELPDVDVGIGVSAGPAVVGNVGAAERFEYTAIGDPVNEAARLTELAKERPGRVVASGAAVDAAGDEEAGRWREDGEEALRGRSTVTRLAVPRG